jgi:hypothetical protein
VNHPALLQHDEGLDVMQRMDWHLAAAALLRWTIIESNALAAWYLARVSTSQLLLLLLLLLQVHFLETLHALASRVAGTLVPEGEESKVHKRLYPRLPLPPTDPHDAPKYTVAHFYAALYVQAAVRGFLRRHALHGAGGVTMGFQSMASVGFQSMNLGALGEPSPDEEHPQLDAMQ